MRNMNEGLEETIEVEYDATLRIPIEHVFTVNRREVLLKGKLDKGLIEGLIIDSLELDDVFDDYMKTRSPNVEVLDVDFDLEGL